MPDPVDGRDVDPVGDRVGPLDRLPGRGLRLTELGLLGGMPADRRGVEEDLGAAQGRQAGRLGVPLVPADEGPHAGVCGLERQESQVAGREVILLVIERVVGDVHLAVASPERAIGIEDDRGVVIDAGRAALEHRADHDHARLVRQPGQRLGGRTGDRLGEIESRGVLDLAEILRAEQFRQTGDLRTAIGRGAEQCRRPAQVILRVVRASHLDQADGERAGLTAHGNLRAVQPWRYFRISATSDLKTVSLGSTLLITGSETSSENRARTLPSLQDSTWTFLRPSRCVVATPPTADGANRVGSKFSCRRTSRKPLAARMARSVGAAAAYPFHPSRSCENLESVASQAAAFIGLCRAAPSHPRPE